MPKRFEPLNTGVFIGSVVFTALAWGMGSAYFMLHSREELLQTLMLICTVGFVAGGVLSFMPLLYLAVVYNILMMLPSITAVFIRAEIPTLGFAMILYAVYLIRSAPFRSVPMILNALQVRIDILCLFDYECYITSHLIFRRHYDRSDRNRMRQADRRSGGRRGG